MKTLNKVFILNCFIIIYFLFFFAACKVLYKRDTIVIGPTPPGIGVIFEAFLLCMIRAKLETLKIRAIKPKLKGMAFKRDNIYILSGNFIS